MISDAGVNVLFTGCSHCVILNILERCEQRTGIVPDRVIGGFHLLNPHTGKSVEPSVLKEWSTLLCHRPTVYHTCHCTGLDAFEQLHARMDHKVLYMSTGEEIIL